VAQGLAFLDLLVDYGEVAINGILLVKGSHAKLLVH
jgi:hypothetical protein